MMNREQCKAYAPIVARLGMSAVYLWFGINQLVNPKHFLDYLPGFLYSSSYATTAIYANGAFEVVLGIMLAAGFLTSIVAALLALHLCAISVELGYGDVAIRDFGLMLATIAVALHGPDTWCIDTRRHAHENQ